MRTLLKLVCLFVVLSFVTALFAEDFEKAQYFKKNANGKKSDPVSGVLRIVPETKEIQFLDKKSNVEVSVKPSQIRKMIYERTAKPRYAAGLLIAWPLLFTKSKSHYLTVEYTAEDGSAQYAIFRLDKGNFREALTSIETQTGKSIDRSEEN